MSEMSVSERELTAPRRDSGWLHALALAACVLTPILAAASAPTALRAAASLLFLCLVPGCALALLLGLRRELRECGLVLGLSLGGVTLLAELLLAAHSWHPVAATDAIATACTPILAVAVWRRRSQLGAAARAAVGRLAGVRGSSGRVALQAALAGGALAAWLVAVHQLAPGGFSGFGLVAFLPPAYYVALALAVLGFVLAVTRPQPSHALLALNVALLILVLHGTTAAAYPEPRYTWVYKHFGVIDYISVHGSVDRDVDVYQNWPGFFAMNAWFSQLSGWRPIDYAAWAQVFFELLNTAALLFALRGLTRRRRHLWLAIWVFALANWIGQDYLAPQAFGFFEGLLVLGLVLRCSARDWPGTTTMGVRLQRLLSRRREGRGERAPAPLGQRSALLAGAICFLALVVSHQLTPFMVLAILVPLTLLRWSRPVWLPLPMIAAVGAWLLLAWPFVAAHFQIFSPDIPSTQNPPLLSDSTTLAGVAFVRAGEFLLTGFVIGLAAAETIFLLRRRAPGATVGVMAAAPFAVAVLQSYGGESYLRAYLFALPWLAYLVASLLLATLSTLPARRWRWDSRLTLVAVSAALAIPFLFAYFGQESANFVSRGDVAVNQWYATHAAPGAVVSFVAPNAPARLSASYAELNINDSGETLIDDRDLAGRPFVASDIGRIVLYLEAQHGSARYLVLSPTQSNYLRLYGLVPPQWSGQLMAGLRSSPYFRLVYQSGSAAVFQLIGTPVVVIR